MTSKFSIDNRDLLQRISSGEAVVGIDFGNLIIRELAAFRLAAMDSDPVAWIAQNKNTGEVEIDEPFAKATNPKYWTDAFPVYASPQPAPVVPDEVLKSLDLLFHRSYFRRWVKDPQGYVSGSIPVRDLVNVVLFAEACRAAMLTATPQESKK